MPQKYIVMKEASENLMTINNFFKTLNSNADGSIKALVETICKDIFGSNLPVKEFNISTPLESIDQYAVAEAKGIDYKIKITLKYPESSPLSKFIELIDIDLSGPDVIEKNKQISVYFDTNTITLLMSKEYNKIELPLDFIVYYSVTTKNFDVVINE